MQKKYLYIVIASVCATASLQFLANQLQRRTSTHEIIEFEQQSLSEPESQLINLFKTAAPSVVYIQTTRTGYSWRRQPIDIPSGTGSAFVWDEQGHIVTNWHVIQNASSATVVDAQGQEHRATLLGASPMHDLAVLQIEDNTLPALAIAKSDSLQVGQSIAAIGNPFGLDHTLTTGVISALGRQIHTHENTIEDTIQIDAAINPGNSGGPLLNSSGHVIGINTAIYSPSGASAGIGFAVPSDTMLRVIPALIEDGNYQPPQIGVHTHVAAERSLQRRSGIQGAFFFEVTENSPASLAGLIPTEEVQPMQWRLGDVIQKVGQRPIQHTADLLRTLDRYQTGDRVTLTILRNNEHIEIELTLQ